MDAAGVLRQVAFDGGLTWLDVTRLGARTGLPLPVRGIAHPEDARLAVEHGAAGVVVSDHGGRQLDTVPATVELLPAVVEAPSRCGAGADRLRAELDRAPALCGLPALGAATRDLVRW